MKDVAVRKVMVNNVRDVHDKVHDDIFDTVDVVDMVQVLHNKEDDEVLKDNDMIDTM